MRPAGSTPSRSHRPATPRRLLVAPLAALLAWGCTDGVPQGSRAPVLLVSIDTLRSDRLPVYGYEGVETPAIDALAADGIVFERVFAHAPITLPSHVSLLSGRLPSRHGVRDNPGYRLPEQIEWLPALLRERGYATGAAVSASVLDAATGMSRGFDHYEDRLADGAAERPGEATVAAALAWLDQLGGGRPWFLFVHINEPHRPYEPHAPFDRFGGYDGEIATADAAVGSLLRALRARDLYDPTMILLTSDHGEGLGEHGERDHGVFVYRESLQVPLVVKLPRGERAGQRVEGPVQLIDVVPTLAATLLGEGRPELPGVSLLGERERQPLIYAESYLPRLYYGASELKTLIGPRLQYIDSPEPELYDLIADPAGVENLVGSDPEIVDLYRRRIAQLTAELPPPSPIGEATLQRLRSLAPADGAVPASGTDLPAPAAQLELLEVIAEAYAAANAADWEGARRGFRRALATNPLAAFAWAQLGRTEEALGREEVALDAWRMALELGDYAPFRLIPAARLALRVGELETAEDLARRALDWAPAEAYGTLSRAALGRGDLEAARPAALSALEADAAWTAPALQLLSVYLRTGRAQQGLAFADEIERRVTAPPVGLNLLIAEALVQLGREEEAVDWVEKEIARFPERPRAYGYLATLYGRLERAEEAGHTIDRLLDNVAGPVRYETAARTLLQLGFPDEAVALLGRGRAEYPESAELERLLRTLATRR